MENKQLCVRSIKLKGVYSECLIMKPESLGLDSSMLKEGQDMMKSLGITKWEPPVRQVQLASGRKVRYQDNSNFHIYYKFPNLKNVQGMFNEEDLVELTRKIHGTSARYGIVREKNLSIWDKVKRFFGNEWVEYEYVYGSHNVEKGSGSQGFYDTDVWAEVANRLDIKNKLWEWVKENGRETIGEGIIIYGEIFGKGIQKNYDYGLDEIKFNGFDVKLDGDYVTTYESWRTIDLELGLEYVPMLHFGYWSQEIQDKYVFNNFIEGTKVPHEGIVIKHYTGERNKVAKCINPDYIIYGEKHDVGDSH